MVRGWRGEFKSKLTKTERDQTHSYHVLAKKVFSYGAPSRPCRLTYHETGHRRWRTKRPRLSVRNIFGGLGPRKHRSRRLWRWHVHHKRGESNVSGHVPSELCVFLEVAPSAVPSVPPLNVYPAIIIWGFCGFLAPAAAAASKFSACIGKFRRREGFYICAKIKPLATRENVSCISLDVLL